MIGALEATQSIAIEIGTDLRVLIGTISTIIGAIAKIRGSDTQIVVTLETRFGTVASAGETRRTANLIGHIATITIAITAEVGGNTMTRHALECAVLALITLAI